MINKQIHAVNHTELSKAIKSAPYFYRPFIELLDCWNTNGNIKYVKLINPGERLQFDHFPTNSHHILYCMSSFALVP
jgi:hypothetical protein